MPKQTETQTDPNVTSTDTSLTLVQPELSFTVIEPGQKPGRAAFKISTEDEIVIPDDLSEEEWCQGLHFFKRSHIKLKLWFSGYLSFGQIKFGKEKVDTALAQLEFDMPMVTQALDIGTVPDEMRFHNLTAEHYIILARADDLTKPKKIKWAKIASEQNLSPLQLKASIAAGEVVSTAGTRQLTQGIVSIHGIRQELDLWLHRVKGVEGILKMDLPLQQEILNEIEPIAFLYEELKAGMAKKPKGKKIVKKT